jgi:hypothetical protein
MRGNEIFGEGGWPERRLPDGLGVGIRRVSRSGRHGSSDEADAREINGKVDKRANLMVLFTIINIKRADGNWRATL